MLWNREDYNWLISNASVSLYIFAPLDLKFTQPIYGGEFVLSGICLLDEPKFN